MRRIALLALTIALALTLVSTASAMAFHYNGTFTKPGWSPDHGSFGSKCGGGQTTCNDELYCTETMGGWGSWPHGQNTGALLANNWNDVVGSELVIGTGHAMIFTSASAVTNYLPSGGTSESLSSNVTNPTTNVGGVLGGQLTALELNILFADAGVGKAGSSASISTSIIEQGPFSGLSVSAFRDLAFQAFGGDTSVLVPYNASLSDVAETATKINENYDDCSTDKGFLTPVCGPAPYCGDGIVNQASEQCDGTAGVGPHQSCSANCTLINIPYCGDGIVNQASEQCDGSAGVGPGQTCNAECQLVNLTCVQAKDAGLLYATIENGTAHITNNANVSYDVGLAVYQKYNETIDDQKIYANSTGTIDGLSKLNLSVDTPSCNYQIDVFCGPVLGSLYHQRYGDRIITSNQIYTDAGFCTVPTCGDGVIDQPSEQCDGSAGVGPNQICTSQCTLQNITYCGDGIKQTPNQAGTGGPLNNGNESCDGTDGVGPHQTCTANCTLQNLPYCGDGIVNQASEQCDGSAGVGPHQSCSANCTLINLPYCGDGIVNQASEQCDGSAGVGPNEYCDASCHLHNVTNSSCSLKPGDFCTQTQGGYSGVCTGKNPSCLLTYFWPYLMNLTNGTLTVGIGHNLTFTSALAVQLYLPAGGPPEPLNTSYVNATSTESGVLGGQLTTLEINLLFSDSHIRGTLNYTNVSVRQLVIDQGKFQNMTVGDFMTLAEEVLGGDTSVLSAYNATVSDVNDAATKINENFVDCVQDNGFLIVPDYVCKPKTYCGDGIVQSPNDYGQYEQCDGSAGVGPNQICTSQCTLQNLTYCGDGIKQTPNQAGTGGPLNNGNESCDGTDGVGPHQSCTANCTLVNIPYCGDGIVNQASEQCDGSAGVGPHQSCTANCTLVNIPYCGDGIVNQASEQCDGSAGVGPHQSCSANCTLINIPYCGDGIVNQASEQCDGSAGVGPNQVCTSNCTLQNLTYCGDGIKQTPNQAGTGGPLNNGNESCDGTDGVGPHQSCTANCTLVNIPYCGDGIVNQASEQCDGSAGVGPHQSCTANCTLVNIPYCGDGIVNQASEQCDGSAGVGPHQVCTSNCTLQNLPYCGDGIVNQASEQCDGSAGVGPHQSCTANCTLVNIPYCGDGIVNQASEQCDGSAGVGPGQTCTAECQLVNLTCVQAKDAGLLYATIENGTAHITNNANVSYDVGLAVYQKYNETIDDQKIYANSTGTIDALSKMNLSVDLPECNYQIDVFCGPVLGSLYHQRYGDRIITSNQIYTDAGFCTVPRCGDGIINQPSEQCDGSAGVGPHQICTAQCTLQNITYCGDGIKQTPNQAGTGGPLNNGNESCDGTDGVGPHQSCTANCTLVNIPYCGDGIVNQASEQCDGSAGVGPHQSCTANCTLVNIPYCGDGIVNQASEQCDGSAGVGSHQVCTSNCTLQNLPYCGDGVINQASEQCDGSAGVGPHQSCTANCTLVNIPYCGDGIVNQASEQCDGSAGVGPHQSCTANCTLVNIPYCGDGIVNQASEQCDGSAGVGPHQSCTANCTLVNIPYCGDGIVNQASEQCDGSAGVGPHQSCTANCTLVNIPYCGDGIVNQASEQCDGSAGVGPHQSCTANCTLVNIPYCGDGIVNQASEQCDGSAGVGPHQVCTSNCTLQNLPYCGDGVINQASEQCDGSAGVGPHQSCTANCTLVNIPYCGDGIVNQASEQCDGSAGVGPHQVCTSNCTLQNLTYCGDGIKQTPNQAGTGGPLNDGNESCDGTDGVGPHQTCTAQCTIQNLPYCGDGIVNQVSEQCDGSAPAGFTCTAQCQLEPLCTLPNVSISFSGPIYRNGSTFIDTVSRIHLNLSENLTEACVNRTTIQYSDTLVGAAFCVNETLCSSYSGTENWTNYTGPFGLKAQGCHVIDYRAANDTNATVGRACVFHDATPPTPVKTVGDPKTPWNGTNPYYPAAEQSCADGGCYRVTTMTPITMSCVEPQGPSQSGVEKLCYTVGLDGNDTTAAYCSASNGTMVNGACCVMSNTTKLTFHKESWHRLSYTCTDHVNKTSQPDTEYFKVQGGSFTIHLNKKWNLISVPFRLLNDQMTAIFNQTSKVISVWGYDATTQEWHVYTPDGVNNDDLHAMLPGYGYWVLTNGSENLTIGGSLFSPAITPPEVTVAPGWNLLGYYGTLGYNATSGNTTSSSSYNGPNPLFGDTASCVFASLPASIFDTSYAGVYSYWEPYNPNQWYFTLNAARPGLNSTDRLDPGAGYWVFSTANTSRLYAPDEQCNLGVVN